MAKTTIAIDLDGVIWDLVTPWIEFYNKIANDNVVPYKINTYDLRKHVKYPELLFPVLERQDFWENVELMNYVEDAFEILNGREDVEYFISTATSYKVPREKFDRLFELLPFLTEDKLIITGQKKLLNVDFIIDDWEGNLMNLKSRYTVPILINQPYNKLFHFENRFGISRANNLLGAVEAIERYIEDITYEKDLNEEGNFISTIPRLKAGGL